MNAEQDSPENSEGNTVNLTKLHANSCESKGSIYELGYERIWSKLPLLDFIDFPEEPEKGFMRQDEFLAHTQP